MQQATVTLESAEALAELKEIEKKSQRAMERTMKDIRSRGPAWIAKGITKDYSITSAQVKSLSKLRVTGNGIGDLTFTYTGRMLSPTHFKMSPTAPKPGAYTIKASIVRGRRSTLGRVKKLTKKQRANIGRNFTRKGTRNSPSSPPMLVQSSAKGGASYLPFIRTKQPGNFDKAVKVISVPQMIQTKDGTTKASVKKELNDGIWKRFEHQLDNIFD